MLLEVLVRTAIFDKLCCSGQHVWILVKRDRLNNIGREQVHQWLNFVHFCVHRGWNGVIWSERLKHCLPIEALSL